MAATVDSAMKFFTWGYIVGGVIIAVIAGLIVQWLRKTVSAPNCLAATSAWRRQVSGGPGGYIFGSGVGPDCGWQENNFNSMASVFGPTMSDCPRSASAYAGGAPVTNYRAFTKIGDVQVPSG